MKNKTPEELLRDGYTATRLMQDEGFERGFFVSKYDQTANYFNHGRFQDYCDKDVRPLWGIGPWWSRIDLYENRDTETNVYTFADKYGIYKVVYNPDEKSLLLRLNAARNFEGKPFLKETHKWWPHLLVEQSHTLAPDYDKVRNTACADRMFAEIDIRLLDFKDTTNPEGVNVCLFPIYFYLVTDKAPGKRIWFGLTLFNTEAFGDNRIPFWHPDSAAHQYIYGMPMALVFDGMENSFMPEKGKFAVSDEWMKLRVDVTAEIDRAIEWANRDNIFGVQVTKEDMYFSGVNIGFEIWGNFDCTFEFKNFNMVSYNLNKDPEYINELKSIKN